MFWLSVKHNMLFATAHMIKFFINFCSSYSLCSAVIRAKESITNNEIWFIVNCIYKKMHWNTWSLKEDGWFNCSYTVTETTKPISPLSLCMCVRAWVIEGRARVRARLCCLPTRLTSPLELPCHALLVKVGIGARASKRRAAANLRTNSINGRADAQRSPPFTPRAKSWSRCEFAESPQKVEQFGLFWGRSNNIFCPDLEKYSRESSKVLPS